MKPKKILDQLREKGLFLKNKSQINNYLKELRKNKYGSTKIGLGDIEKWCVDRNKIPELNDEPFVVAYSIIYQIL